MVLVCLCTSIFSRVYISMEVKERMITYILILIIVYGSSGIAVTTQEFDSKTTCEAAEKALITTKDWRFFRVTTECMKK